MCSLTTFGLKGGVNLLWYRSSQFMGLKNTWFFMSSCREKTLVSSPHHIHSPTGTHNWPPTRKNSAALAGLLSPESILLTDSLLCIIRTQIFPYSHRCLPQLGLSTHTLPGSGSMSVSKTAELVIGGEGMQVELEDSLPPRRTLMHPDSSKMQAREIEQTCSSKTT